MQSCIMRPVPLPMHCLHTQLATAPRWPAQASLLLAAMQSLARLDVAVGPSGSYSDGQRSALIEMVCWAWWLKNKLPEPVCEVSFSFWSYPSLQECVVRSEGESLEQMLGRLALAAGSWLS